MPCYPSTAATPAAGPVRARGARRLVAATVDPGGKLTGTRLLISAPGAKGGPISRASPGCSNRTLNDRCARTKDRSFALEPYGRPNSRVYGYASMSITTFHYDVPV